MKETNVVEFPVKWLISPNGDTFSLYREFKETQDGHFQLLMYYIVISLQQCCQYIHERKKIAWQMIFSWIPFLNEWFNPDWWFFNVSMLCLSRFMNFNMPNANKNKSWICTECLLHVPITGSAIQRLAAVYMFAFPCDNCLPALAKWQNS